MPSRKLIRIMAGGILMWLPIAKALAPHLSDGWLFLAPFSFFIGLSILVREWTGAAE